MLESLLARVLNRLLGVYIQKFNAEQLQVGIFNGNVVLRNLDLRREALDQLRLPLNVIGGRIGYLELQIPWSNLRGQPVQITVEDVLLLAVPRTDSAYDPTDEEERELRLKMEKLENAEELKDRAGGGMEEMQSQSFTTSLITAITDNVQISVKNIHVRYEDSLSDPGHPFALGITLEHFSAVSTDAEWAPTFIQSSMAEMMHKLASLKSLAVYWDTDVVLIGAGKSGGDNVPIEHITEKLRGMIVAAENGGSGNHQYLLKPVTGKAYFEIDKTGKADRAKVKSKLSFDELGFILDDSQYRDALMLVDLFHYYIRRQECRRYEPRESIKENPLAWFKFAGEMVLRPIKERNRRWSWAGIKERRDDRREYIKLFKQVKRGEALSEPDQTRLDELHRKYTYQDLRFWRSLARSQLRKENVGIEKQAPKQGWLQWVWGETPKQSETEVARKELFEAIDWDEKKSLADEVDVPREYVKFITDLVLQTGSLTLRTGGEKQNEMAKLEFNGFSANTKVRKDSILANVSLDEMQLFDGTTPGTLYHKIISMKNGGEGRVSEASRDGSPGHSLDPFFSMEFEHNPLDNRAHNALSLKLKAMEVFYNPQFIVGLADFFRPPEMHMESIEMLMETAGEAVEGIRKQTRAGLEYALEIHQKLDLSLDVQAPLIFIPNSVTEESQLCLVIDAGHILMTSQLADESKEKKGLDEMTEEELREEMYDKFLLKLKSTQVLMGSTVAETRKGLEENGVVGGRRLELIHRIDVDFILRNCILQRSSNLTQFQMSGDLPVLHVSVSDDQYLNLMRLIDYAIPKFSQNEADGSDVDSKRRINEVQEHPRLDRRTSSFTLSQPLRLFSNDDFDDNDSAYGDAIGPEVDQDGSPSSSNKEPAAPLTTEIQVATGKASKSTNTWTRRLFEFSFRVARFQGSVYKGRDMLVDLVAKNFSFDFSLRQYDFTALVQLDQFYVDDYVAEQSHRLPAFGRKLVRSGEEGRKLLTVKCVRVMKESPEFEKHEKVGIDVEVEVSRLDVVVERKSLLTLLDFVLVTFGNNQNSQNGQNGQNGLNEQNQIKEQPSLSLPPAELPKPNQENNINGVVQGQNIKVKVGLEKMSFVLNNSGIQLGTMSLESADVGVFLRDTGTMIVNADIGDLQLVDDKNQLSTSASTLLSRPLVSIKSSEITKLQYETFTAEETEKSGFNASLLFHSSMKINFVPQPIHEIGQFLIEFGRMHTIFTEARLAAAQTVSEMQERAGKVRLDVKVTRPTIFFPAIGLGLVRDGDDRENVRYDSRDEISATIEKIYLLTSLDGGEDVIEAGAEGVWVGSSFWYGEGSGNRESGRVTSEREEVDVVKETDLKVVVRLGQDSPNASRRRMDVKSRLSPTRVHLTQQQARFVMELVRVIPKVVTFGNESAESAKTSRSSSPGRIEEDKSGATESSPVSLFGSFASDLLEVELVPATSSISVETPPLARLKLTNMNVSLSPDEANPSVSRGTLSIDSFDIKDCRVMAVHEDMEKQKFEANVRVEQDNGSTRVYLESLVDRPRMVLSLEYLLGLREFVDGAVAGEAPAVEDQKQVDKSKQKGGGGGISISMEAVLTNSRIVLLANPSSASTEAIVLDTGSIHVWKQGSVTLNVGKVGMFLCKMDEVEATKLRILDDFDFQLSLSISEIGNGGSRGQVVAVHADVSPLAMRVSLREILMVMQIVQKANERVPRKRDIQEIADVQEGSSESDQDSSQSLSLRGKALKFKPSASVKTESFTASFSGLQLVVIGHTHSLPMLDITLDGFSIKADNWSEQPEVVAPMKLMARVYNFSKSAWEPLVERWPFRIRAEQEKGSLTLAVESDEILQTTVTAATIAIGMQCVEFLTSHEDVVGNSRAQTSPYKIRNLTGAPVRVWKNLAGVKRPDGAEPDVEIVDGEEVPWSFEDAQQMRETLNPESTTGFLDVEMVGTGYDTVRKIRVQREGEAIYSLKPASRYQARLTVDISLGRDRVKCVTLRSPFVIDNGTAQKIEVGVAKQVVVDEREEWKIFYSRRIDAGQIYAIPVTDAYGASVVIRLWEEGNSIWKEHKVISWAGSHGLFAVPSRTLKGPLKGDGTRDKLRVHAKFNSDHPLYKKFPNICLRVVAPIRIHSLLPVDSMFSIYDADDQERWSKDIKSGEVAESFLYDLDRTLTLGLNHETLHPVTFPSAQVEGAFISSRDEDVYSQEHCVKIIDRNGRSVQLKLLYSQDPDDGGAFTVTIFPTHIVRNRTSAVINIREPGFLGNGILAGNGLCEPGRMVIFSTNKGNKSRLAFQLNGMSEWSSAISFDTLGAAVQVAVPESEAQVRERQGNAPRVNLLGVHVQVGDGAFRVIKVVTVAPRYVIHNQLPFAVQARQPSRRDSAHIESGTRHQVGYIDLDKKGVLFKFRVAQFDGQWTDSVNLERPEGLTIKYQGRDVRVLIRSTIVGATQVIELVESAERTSTQTVADIVDRDLKNTRVAKSETDLFRLKLAGIGLSIVSRREILYATAAGIRAKLTDSIADMGLSLSVNRLQLDNQLPATTRQVVLTGVTRKESGQKPVLTAAASRSKKSTQNLIIIPYMTLLLQELAVQLDDGLILSLLEFMKDAFPGSQEIHAQAPFSVAERTTRDAQGTDYLFHRLLLQPIVLNFSFSLTPRISDLENKLPLLPTNPLSFLFRIISASVVEVSNAPIRYQPLVLENARLPMATLLSAIQSHYVQASLAQFYNFFGSAKVIGNPIGLFNQVSSGIVDIFYMPYRGIVDTDRPRDVGLGFVRGASSFIQKSIFGVSDSVAGIAGSLSNGLAAATMDSRYLTQRQIAASRPQSANIFSNVASSVADGVLNLGLAPLRGAEREGVSGFLKGLGAGVVGLATKPAVGVLDSASTAAGSVRDTTTLFKPHSTKRARLPRYIPESGIVGEFDETKALGQHWLQQLEKFYKYKYIGHVLIPGEPSRRRDGSEGKRTPERILFVAYQGLVMVYSEKMRVDWDLPLDHIHTIAKQKSAIEIELQNETKGPTIRMKDVGDQSYIYNCITEAVTSWNERWNIVK